MPYVNDWLSRPHCLVLLSVIGAVIALIAIVRPDAAAAQGINVQITELDCNSNPEMIVISNLGTEPVEMTGWNLQSDPTTQESLALASLGTLSPGGVLFVESGPAAAGALTWSQEFLFRDNDATDFAQLASDAGDVLVKVNCAQPTPASTALPASNVPVGGGAPAPVGAGITPAVMIVVGSWLLAAGMATFAFPWLRRGREAEAPDEESPPEPVEAQVTVPDERPDRPFGEADPLRMFLMLAVILLALASVLVFLLQVGEKKEE